MTTKSRKPGVGSVFEIKTRKGYAYFQWVSDKNRYGDLIWVYNHVHPRPLEKLDQLTEGDHDYLTSTFVKSIVKYGESRYVGDLPLPNEYRYPPLLRTLHMRVDGTQVWHILVTATSEQYVKGLNELTEEEKRAGMSGYIGDLWLIMQLDAGWNLENWATIEMEEYEREVAPPTPEEIAAAEKYLPFVLLEDDTVVTVDLEADANTSLLELFRKHGYEGNGYCWEGHITQMLEQLDRKLLKSVEFDPEAGSFSATLSSRKKAQRFLELLCSIFRDHAELEKWILKADRGRIDD